MSKLEFYKGFKSLKIRLNSKD
ncbi:hypothetical protein A5865_003256 [Enterococcus sp. 12E11_DIV0728]|nr:hypothetical protein A5865_003256 [Enterococcus sp. 12E11_DIV0728]